MSLSQKIIQNLRQKPEAVRLRILLVVMAIITIIVVGSWIFIFRYERSTSNQGQSAQVNFFKSIAGSFSSSIKSISD